MRCANVPPEQLRMHLCWGNYEGPHHCDVPLADIIDIVFTARPSAISFEAANPRHAHEWTLFETVKLPEGKMLIPGVIESKSNFIEHPELIAQRIARYANLVGARERHRGQRLRLRHLGRPGRGRSRCRLGEARRDGRGRAPRLEAILEGVSRLARGLRLFYDGLSHRAAPDEQEVPMANDVSTITKPGTKSGAKPGMKAGYSSAKKPVMVPGRRDFFAYRDLGVKDASDGTMRAQLTTANTGMTQPTGWHYHVCDHQFVYALKGWVELEFENGETLPARSRRLRLSSRAG